MITIPWIIPLILIIVFYVIGYFKGRNDELENY